MANIASLKETLNDATAVRAVWESIPNYTMGTVTFNEFTTLHDLTNAFGKEYAKKDVELTEIKDERDDNARRLNDLITRFRSGMRSVYGPDSTKYQQAGGTRTRNRRTPKPKATAASA